MADRGTATHIPSSPFRVVLDYDPIIRGGSSEEMEPVEFINRDGVAVPIQWAPTSDVPPPDPDPEALSLLASPWAATAYTDGGGSLRVGNSFYTTRPGGINVIGARLHVPAGASGGWLTEDITFYAYGRDYSGSPFSDGIPAGSPVQTKVSAGPRSADAWIDVVFDTPFPLAALDSGTGADDVVAIAYQSATGNLYAYYSASQFTTAVESQHLDDVFLAEAGLPNGFNNLGSAGVVWYGLDLLYEVI